MPVSGRSKPGLKWRFFNVICCGCAAPPNKNRFFREYRDRPCDCPECIPQPVPEDPFEILYYKTFSVETYHEPIWGMYGPIGGGWKTERKRVPVYGFRINNGDTVLLSDSQAQEVLRRRREREQDIAKQTERMQALRDQAEKILEQRQQQ